ncbi:MAG: class I SAM-dependent methyltransferase [Anaerolineae bacterium]|nr:class I SAM-dependent methyltransferase [Anaerolineae bacterium]
MHDGTRQEPLFDALAAGYDGWFATPLGAHAFAVEREALLALTPEVAGEKALDAGCGTGVFTHVLAEAGADVTGIDISPAMLRRAQARGLPVAQAGAHALPFAAGSLDLIWSVTMLEFVADPAGAVAEMARVLRPGGRLVAGTINGSSRWAEYYRRQQGTVFQQAHFLTPAELVGLLKRYGRVTWHTVLFVPPSYGGRRPGMAWLLEWLGRRLLPGRGGFLATAVQLNETSIL